MAGYIFVAFLWYPRGVFVLAGVNFSQESVEYSISIFTLIAKSMPAALIEEWFPDTKACGTRSWTCACAPSMIMTGSTFSCGISRRLSGLLPSVSLVHSHFDLGMCLLLVYRGTSSDFVSERN